MGAKLSKKKKGYCLGAGKDGESTETTEVEQKETENQEGQKDAAEPNGEKAPTDQSQNNGVCEEQKDKKAGAEITTGETTKEESNKDQKPEIKSSTEQEKAEVKDQPQGKEREEAKMSAPEKICEKVESASDDKTKNECEVKVAAADKSTQEFKPVKETEGSDCKESHSSETKSLTPVQDEVKQVSEPVIKVEAEQTESVPAPVEAQEHVSEKAGEVATQANGSVVEPEKVPEKVEPSAPESVPVKPLSEPDEETSLPEPIIKTKEVEAVEPASSKPIQITEVSKPEAAAVPENLDSALPNSEPTSEAVNSVLAEQVEPASNEPELALEPEPEPAVKPVLEAVPEIKVDLAVPEQPTALPEQNVEAEDEMVPCPASEKISEPKEELTSEPLPPKSIEVPDKTADAQEHSENRKSFGCVDQGENIVNNHAHVPEAIFKEQPSAVSEHVAPVIQNGPSENYAEDVHHISTEPTVEDGEQKLTVEENGSLVMPLTQLESQMVKSCNAPIDVVVSSENDYTIALDTNKTHDASQHCNSENHDLSAEEVKNENEPPAPEILEKHGVGNGLPIKEEIKVHLDNNCDTDLHEINGQSENQEIQVCNE